MSDMRSDLAKTIRRLALVDGLQESCLRGTHCIKISQTDRRAKRYWRASLSIVAQGCKEIVLGREVYRCDGGHYIAAPIDLPVSSRILSATPEHPFLCLKIDFDSLTLSQVATHMQKVSPIETENPLRALFIGKASDKMLDAALRLGMLLQTPDDVRVLGPLVIREILYHLLKGSDGPAIRQFVRAGSKMHKISQALYSLKADLSEDVDITSLAKSARMSRSAFFKHFKEATSMSPIQYQKLGSGECDDQRRYVRPAPAGRRRWSGRLSRRSSGPVA